MIIIAGGSQKKCKRSKEIRSKELRSKEKMKMNSGHLETGCSPRVIFSSKC